MHMDEFAGELFFYASTDYTIEWIVVRIDRMHTVFSRFAWHLKQTSVCIHFFNFRDLNDFRHIHGSVFHHWFFQFEMQALKLNENKFISIYILTNSSFMASLSISHLMCWSPKNKRYFVPSTSTDLSFPTTSGSNFITSSSSTAIPLNKPFCEHSSSFWKLAENSMKFYWTEIWVFFIDWK